MLDDAFAHFKRQVKSAKGGIFLLERFRDAKGVQIVIEAFPVALHQAIERRFAGMPKGRMTHVVDERKSLNQVDVQPERRSNGAADLGHLQSMGQAVAKMIRIGTREDLSLVFEAAESPRMNDAVAVPHVVVSISVRTLGVPPSPGLFDPNGVTCKNRCGAEGDQSGCKLTTGSAGHQPYLIALLEKGAREPDQPKRIACGAQ